MDPTVWYALRGNSFIRTSRVGYSDIRTPVDEPTLSSALVNTIDHVLGTRSLLEVQRYDGTAFGFFSRFKPLTEEMRKYL